MADDPIDRMVSPQHPNPQMREGLFTSSLSAQQARDLEMNINRGNESMLNFGELNRRTAKPELFSLETNSGALEAALDDAGNKGDPSLGGTKRLACFQCGESVNPKGLIAKRVMVVNHQTGEEYMKIVNVHINPCTDNNVDDSEFGARIN
jgi:hypothetical protein